MAEREEYDRMWDMLVEMHRRIHGDAHVPVKDFNCCDEYAVMMALRAASTVKPEYPPHLLRRIAALPDLDREVYVKNVLSTDGEPEPTDPVHLREYRASRRYYVLWGELKAAAARIAELEAELRDARAKRPPA